MTDREPDDLYDALRNRLADYGQEPPAQLWAGIRAKLPPPVAQPQLRKRRRRLAPLGLLLLLFTAISGAGWYWWQTASPAQRLGGTVSKVRTMPRASAPAAASERSTTVISNSPSELDELTTAAQPTHQPATGKTPGAEPVATSAPNTTRDVAAGPARPAADLPKHSNQPAPAALAPSATSRRPKRPDTAREWAAVASNTGRPAALAQSRRTRRPAPSAAFATTSAAPDKGLTSAGRLRIESSSASTSSIVTGAPAPAASMKQTEKTTPGAQQPAGDVLAAAPPTPTADERMAETSVLARAVALQLAGSAAPATLQPVPTEPQVPPMPVVARWAVQVVGGPALTYRQLGAKPTTTPAPTLINPRPTSFPTSTAARNNATNVADIERPAVGSGFQVSVRRTFTNKWSVSAGLGYSEYATQLAAEQIYTIYADNFMPGFPPISTEKVDRRDTYRFATIPLRVGYAWVPSGRWQVGLSAGTDVAMYVGGQSTEGSLCACQTQTWGVSGSPYRQFSLGASVGAEFRYRLADRWQLVAAPTATYLLTPLARRLTTYYPRHLFGGAALLGVSLDLP